MEYKAPTRTKSDIEKLVELTKWQIAPGDNQVWYQERMQVPPVPPTGLLHCGIIGVNYFLQVWVISFSSHLYLYDMKYLFMKVLIMFLHFIFFCR